MSPKGFKDSRVVLNFLPDGKVQAHLDETYVIAENVDNALKDLEKATRKRRVLKTTALAALKRLEDDLLKRPEILKCRHLTSKVKEGNKGEKPLLLFGIPWCPNYFYEITYDGEGFDGSKVFVDTPEYKKYLKEAAEELRGFYLDTGGEFLARGLLQTSMRLACEETVKQILGEKATKSKNELLITPLSFKFYTTDDPGLQKSAIRDLEGLCKEAIETLEW